MRIPISSPAFAFPSTSEDPPYLDVSSDCTTAEARVDGVDFFVITAPWLKAELRVERVSPLLTVDVRTGLPFPDGTSLGEQKRRGVLCNCKGIIYVAVPDGTPAASWHYEALMPTRTAAWEHIKAKAQARILEMRDARRDYNRRLKQTWAASRAAGVPCPGDVPPDGSVVGEARPAKEQK